MTHADYDMPAEPSQYSGRRAKTAAQKLARVAIFLEDWKSFAAENKLKRQPNAWTASFSEPFWREIHSDMSFNHA